MRNTQMFTWKHTNDLSAQTLHKMLAQIYEKFFYVPMNNYSVLTLGLQKLHEERLKLDSRSLQ